MAAISSITSSASYTPPVVPFTPKAKADSPVSAPSAAPDPAKAQVDVAAQAVIAVAAKVAAAVNATSYRNASGDTVSLTNVVLKDRDGDGGVGLPAPKVKVPVSPVQEKVISAYSAN